MLARNILRNKEGSALTPHRLGATLSQQMEQSADTSFIEILTVTQESEYYSSRKSLQNLKTSQALLFL
jgi:hypothetical protein